MTIKEAQELLNDLSKSSPVDLSSMYPTEVLIANKLRSSCSHMSEEEFNEFSKSIAEDKNNFLTQEISSQRNMLQGKIDSLISAVPVIATTATTGVAACTGTSAGAAVGVLGGAAMNAKSIKSMAIDILSSAISLGIELPDSIKTTIETLKPLIKLSI